MALREGDAEHPPLSASSAGRTVVAVRGFHRFAVQDGLAQVDPSAGVRPPTPAKRLPKALPLADVERILEAAGAPGTALALRDRALLEVLYGTGARISEAVGLDVDDLDLERPTRSRAPCCCAARAPRSGSSRWAATPARRSQAYLVRGRPELVGAGTGTAGAVPQRPRRPAVAAERLDGDRPGRRAGRRAAPRSRRTPCGTPSPPTCSTAAPTSASSRSCSATPR